VVSEICVQTDRQMFHRNADHNTPLPHWSSRVITIQYNSQSKASEVLRFPLLLSILSPHCRILQIHTCISSLPQPKSYQYELQRHVFIPQTGIRSLGTLCWNSACHMNSLHCCKPTTHCNKSRDHADILEMLHLHLHHHPTLQHGET